MQWQTLTSAKDKKVPKMKIKLDDKTFLFVYLLFVILAAAFKPTKEMELVSGGQ